MNKEAAIRQYYACFEHKDRARLQELLADDLQFTSSYACYDNRDKMLDEIWPHVVENPNRVAGLEIFGTGNRFMVRYDLTGPASTAMAEFLRFDGEKIVEIAVFIGKSER